MIYLDMDRVEEQAHNAGKLSALQSLGNRLFKAARNCKITDGADSKLLEVTTMDNPGWCIRIDLTNLCLSDKNFYLPCIYFSDTDWFHLFVKDGVLVCYSGPENFTFSLRSVVQLLEVNGEWTLQNLFIESNDQNLSYLLKEDVSETSVSHNNSVNNLDWLQLWYFDNCDEDWEHQFGCDMRLHANGVWRIEVDIEETDLEEHPFDPVKIENELGTWIHSRVNEKKYVAECDLHSIDDAIGLFRKWVNQSGLFKHVKLKMID